MDDSYFDDAPSFDDEEIDYSHVEQSLLDEEGEISVFGTDEELEYYVDYLETYRSLMGSKLTAQANTDLMIKFYSYMGLAAPGGTPEYRAFCALLHSKIGGVLLTGPWKALEKYVYGGNGDDVTQDTVFVAGFDDIQQIDRVEEILTFLPSTMDHYCHAVHKYVEKAMNVTWRDVDVDVDDGYPVLLSRVFDCVSTFPSVRYEHDVLKKVSILYADIKEVVIQRNDRSIVKSLQEILKYIIDSDMWLQGDPDCASLLGRMITAIHYIKSGGDEEVLKLWSKQKVDPDRALSLIISANCLINGVVSEEVLSSYYFMDLSIYPLLLTYIPYYPGNRQPLVYSNGAFYIGKTNCVPRIKKKLPINVGFLKSNETRMFVTHPLKGKYYDKYLYEVPVSVLYAGICCLENYRLGYLDYVFTMAGFLCGTDGQIIDCLSKTIYRVPPQVHPMIKKIYYCGYVMSYGRQRIITVLKRMSKYCKWRRVETLQFKCARAFVQAKQYGEAMELYSIEWQCNRDNPVEFVDLANTAFGDEARKMNGENNTCSAD